ncbi:Seipin [Taenia crassiceps]|uniref:Seipin n=1 Tax=Taenia crassiceps TaxID=6207 RepID=A0ABR4QPK4_9CEST
MYTSMPILTVLESLDIHLTGKIMLPSALRKLGTCVILQVFFILGATITFGIICHVYVPNLSSFHEIHLGFMASEKDRRVFSTDDFSLSKFGASFFTPGQNYKIEFLISVPDSPQNHDVDMSSLRLHLYSLDKNHSTILSNTLLPIYRPWLVDTMDTILYAPFYLFNFCKKEQILRVVFSSNYLDNQDFPTFSGRLILETGGLRWYAATLSISAVLNPILWLIYRYAWLVGFVFVTAVTLALDCLIFCGRMLRRYHHRTDPKPLPPQISKVQMNVRKKAEKESKEDAPLVESIDPSVATKE